MNGCAMADSPRGEPSKFAITAMIVADDDEPPTLEALIVTALEHAR